MNNIYDALEYGLRALEDGADLNSVLARYPEFADELRPILEASIAAREMAAAGPSPDGMQRGRAKLSQRAAELREASAPPPRRVLPVFQRLSLALSIAVVFLLSGTGLVRAAAVALPGEGLYPVKRTWEGVRLFFVFDAKLREALESEYEDERLEEVGELLTEGRYETIQFAGVYMDVNGVAYVSGIRVVIVDATQLPAGDLRSGAAVIVTGHTNAEGFVEVEFLELLPAGTVVPVGNPVKVESETESNESPGSGSGGESSQGSENEAGSSGEGAGPEVRNFQMEGTVSAVSGETLVVNGQTVYLNQPEIKGVIVIGATVKVEGYFAEDGRFIVTKIEVEESHSEDTNGNDNSNSSDENENTSGEDQNNNEDHDSNENDNSGGGNENGEDSGGHGGGSD